MIHGAKVIDFCQSTKFFLKKCEKNMMQKSISGVSAVGSSPFLCC